jgi:hypothetical protein
MPRETYENTVVDWQFLLDHLDQELARSENIKGQVAELESLYARAQQLDLQRNELRAALASATREIQQVLRKGRTTAAYLRTAVKAMVPRESAELRKLGIKLGGRPSKPSRRKRTSDSQK